MPKVAEDLERILKKKLSSLDISVQDYNKLYDRLEKEIAVINEHKLYTSFKAYRGDVVPLEDVLAREDLSVAGFLKKSLHYATLPTPPFSNIEDFWERMQYFRRVKTGGLSHTQLIELILAGAFGDPKVNMERYWDISKQKEPLPDYDYDLEMATRLGKIRNVQAEDAEQILGISIDSFSDFIDPLRNNLPINVIGQLIEKPKVIQTRNGREMAFLNLIPMNAEDYEEPRYDIVIWPAAYGWFKNLEAQKGDVIVIQGTRAYNEKRGTPQVTVDRKDKIAKLNKVGGIWTAQEEGGKRI